MTGTSSNSPRATPDTSLPASETGRYSGRVLTVMLGACAQAARLGHQWVGPEHVLLAILDEGRPSLACSVLNDLGLTHDRAEESFLGSLLNATPPVRSTIADGALTRPAPIFYEMQGWIAGFAAATGTSPTAETALVCLCSLRPDVLAGAVDVDDVLCALDDRGIPVAHSQLPREASTSRRRIDVPIDRLAEIRSWLLDAGFLTGFNIDAENSQAWVIVEDGRISEPV